MNVPTNPSLDAIVARYEPRVLAVCTAVLQDAHLARDAAQDTFVALWREIDDGREPTRLGAWLHTVAARTALDHLRRRRRRAVDALGERVAPQRGPAGDAIAAELRQRFDTAVAALPERQRLTFELRHDGGLPLAEVAALLGVATPTAKTQFARACLKLQSALAPFSDDEDSFDAP